jgi:hypothetical protein
MPEDAPVTTMVVASFTPTAYPRPTAPNEHVRVRTARRLSVWMPPDFEGKDST